MYRHVYFLTDHLSDIVSGKQREREPGVTRIYFGYALNFTKEYKSI